MRFREMSLTFRIAETAEENPDLERHRRYKYPAMKKTLGNVSHIRLLPMLWPRPRPTRRFRRRPRPTCTGWLAHGTVRG